MTDLEKAILRDTQQAIGTAIQTNLTGYNSSFSKMINEVIDDHSAQLKGIIDDNFTKVISSKEFDQSVRNAFSHKLAKVLVNKLEGSVEKCVTTLRSDPTIRAKMILAIEEIVKQTQLTKGS